MKHAFNLCAIAVCIIAGSCRKASDEGVASSPTPPNVTASRANSESQKGTAVSFSGELHVADESVNAFVKSALENCASGQYEALRSVWTAREGPISRDEFEKGWHAAKSIRVRALEKVKLATDAPSSSPETAASPQIAYALAVDLSLDPEQQIGQRKSEREVVLLITREQEEWRLARAPKNMREWIKKKFDPSSTGESKNSPKSDSSNSVKREP